MEPTGVGVIQGAIGQSVDHALQARHVLVVPTRIVVATQFGKLIIGRTEDIGILFPHGLENLNVCTVQGSQGQRTVHHELHVRGAGSFLTSHRNLLGNIRSRNDVFGGRDIVVVNENNLDAAIDIRIVVDQVGNGVNQLNNCLRANVAGGSLRTKDEHALGDVQSRIVLDAEVQIQDVERIKQLALVLVQTLDLNVVDCIWIDLDALAVLNPCSKVNLIRMLNLSQASIKLRVTSTRVLRKRIKVSHPAIRAGHFIQKRCQTGVALLEPTTRSHTIGLIVEALRPNRVPLFESLTLNDFSVQRGHAVDRVRGVAGDPRHADSIARDGGHVVDGCAINAALGHVQAETTIDLSNDFRNTREKTIEDVNVPGLQSLGQNRVVGVRKGTRNNIPGIFPTQAMVIHQDAHEFGNGQNRVGVIELDGVVLSKTAQVRTVLSNVVINDRLQRRRAEEVLLTNTQNLAFKGRIVRVKNTRDIHGALAVDNRISKAL